MTVRQPTAIMPEILRDWRGLLEELVEDPDLVAALEFELNLVMLAKLHPLLTTEFGAIFTTMDLIMVEAHTKSFGVEDLDRLSARGLLRTAGWSLSSSHSTISVIDDKLRFWQPYVVAGLMSLVEVQDGVFRDRDPSELAHWRERELPGITGEWFDGFIKIVRNTNAT